jgi:hypothetical protein
MSETDVIELDLGNEHGTVRLCSWKDIDRWIEAEREVWSWLRPEDGKTNPANVANHVQSHLDRVASGSRQFQQNGSTIEAFRKTVRDAFNPRSGPILPSSSVVGASILDVRGLAGDEGAAAAYAFAIGMMPISQISNRHQLLGVLASTFPGFEQATSVADRLSKERANAKAASRNFIAEVRANEERRDAEWKLLLKRAGGIGRRALRKRQKGWKDQQSFLGSQQMEAINSIREVERAYIEAMRLQAPVKYWEDKAKAHREAEFWAIGRLCLYFPVATLLLGWAFWEAASLLLLSPASGTAALPPAVYVVITGGLAIASTFALWIGRILTKLYLSEHHLRNDAQERAVMTTTYLALTRENAAAETDRSIILNALFRNTPDGIVKEDGPGDLNVAALLSRLGIK